MILDHSAALAMAAEIGSVRAPDSLSSETLDFSGHGLTEIPEDLLRFLMGGASFKEVNMSYNRLTDFPLLVLNSLEILHLQHNQLSHFSAAFANLKYLDLRQVVFFIPLLMNS